MKRSPAPPQSAVSRRARAGMTLVELLVSIGLLILLLAAVFGFYQRSADYRARGNNIAARTQLARVVLGQVAGELRRITPFVPQEFGVGGVGGNLRELTIATFVLPSAQNFNPQNYGTANQATDADMEFVRYYIKLDYTQLDENGNPAVLGLYRSSCRNRGLIYGIPTVVTTATQPAGDQTQVTVDEVNNLTVDPTTYIQDQMISDQIQYLRVRYNDGTGWQEQWNSATDPMSFIQGQLEQTSRQAGGTLNGPRIPMAIEITMGFIPDYTLLLADLSQNTSLSGNQTTAVNTTTAPSSNANISASTADETEPHPDRFTIVVCPQMTDKIFGPVSSQISGSLSQFGGSALQTFMQQSNPNLSGFSLDQTQGTQGGMTGPAGTLFGGQ